MDNIRKTLDDSLRKIRGKMEMVRKPRTSVKEWIDNYISKTTSNPLLSLTASLTEDKISSNTTSGPSSVVSQSSCYNLRKLPLDPSSFMSMTVELASVFEADDAIKMKEILEKGMDPNFIDLNGKPLVYRAVEEGKYYILQTMLHFGYGCDVNSTCQDEMMCGWTALHLACHLGDVRAVRILLANQHWPDQCDVNVIDIDRRTPLHILSSSPFWGGSGMDQPDQTEQQEITGVHSMTYYSSDSNMSESSEHLDILRLAEMLKLTCIGTRPAPTTPPPLPHPAPSDTGGLSPHCYIMQLLIDAGAEVNRVDEYNGTPLHICAMRGNMEGLQRLLNAGAKLDLADCLCETALIKAMVHHRTDIVKVLLKADRNFDDAKRFELSNILLRLIDDLSGPEKEAGESQVIGIIQALLRKRIQLNSQDSCKQSLLHLSLLNGCHGVAMTLLQQPYCIVDAQDEHGFTPLFLAAWDPKHNARWETSLVILDELIRRGANVNHEDECGVLPLNVALESGRIHAAALLLQHGALAYSRLWFCSSVEVLRQNSSTLPLVERFVLSMLNNHQHAPCPVEVAALLGQPNFVLMLIAAGAKTKDIGLNLLEHWANNETNECLAEELYIQIEELRELCSNPLSLRYLCRITLRTCLRSKLWQKSAALPLPEKLQQFLMLKEFTV